MGTSSAYPSQVCVTSKTSKKKDHALDEESCKKHGELISTLPKKRASEPRPSLYKYQGFWYHSYVLKGVVTAQNQFQALPTDIFLATFPKSGTTWLKALMHATQNRKSNPDYMMLTRNAFNFMPFLEIDLYANNKVPNLSVFPAPRLLATHIPYTSLPQTMLDSRCKIVYLCRNPKDNFLSLWHFSEGLRARMKQPSVPMIEELKAFCEGWSPFGAYWDHVLGYWNESSKNPDRVLFLKYEEIMADPSSQLKRLSEFMGCPISTEEVRKGVVDEILGLCSFTNMNGNSPSGSSKSPFSRKAQVGNWVNDMTPKLIDLIDKVMEEKFRGSGLKLQLSQSRW